MVLQEDKMKKMVKGLLVVSIVLSGLTVLGATIGGGDE
jgi:hypothetical protein